MGVFGGELAAKVVSELNNKKVNAWVSGYNNTGFQVGVGLGNTVHFVNCTVLPTNEAKISDASRSEEKLVKFSQPFLSIPMLDSVVDKVVAYIISDVV